MSLRPIGEIVAELLPVWGKRAIRHHLGRASNAAPNSPAAAVAFAQANSLRQQMGLSWPEIFAADETNDDRDQRGVA